MSTVTKIKVPYFTAYVTTEVEVDPDELHEEGWHHESECAGGQPPVPRTLADDDVHALGAAVASLHRQAHPSESRSVRLCREEPCRSLTLDQLNEADS